MADKVQLIKEEIEKKRQLIWPTNTGEMKVVDTPKQLIQGWLNCLKWIENFIDSIQEEPKGFFDGVDFLPVGEKQEPISEDLEEEIKDWIKTKHFVFTEIDEIIETARHFAEWQKQQMMKDAVEADVAIDRIGEVVYLCPHRSEKLGDKVKIIICKTEQQ